MQTCSMIRLLARILGTFSIGFLLLGLLLAVLPLDGVKDCGSLLFRGNEECGASAGRLALVLLMLGLSATCLAARVTALWTTPPP